MFNRGGRQDRRGIALVMTMMFMSLMIGASAISIDFGRMMMYRSQLRAAADAAALAGAQQLMRNHSGTAVTTALAIGNSYKVGAGNVTMVAENLEPGTFNTSTGVFTNGTWNTNANAVRATASYTATYMLGQILGGSTLSRSASAIAMVGSITTSSGLRPWAVSFWDMLFALDRHDGGSRVTNNCNATTHLCTYNLTPADIAVFSQMTSVNDSIDFLDGQTGPGGFGAIDDASSYSSAIANGGTSTVAVGQNVGSNTGKSIGPFRSGAQTLCGASGNNFNCNAQISVVVYDQTTGNGNNMTYHVKYVAALTLTHVAATGQMGLTGYFTSATAPGAFSGTAGTVQRLALVK